MRLATQSRSAALIALVSAFSFVVMMINVPLPGGTSGHAIGLGAAVAIVGLWPTVVAISITLLIQALLFGDGGVTTYGANCLNMAIMGSMAAWAVYRVVAGSKRAHGKRAILAASVAGYCGVNFAALSASIEFGVQPMLFTDVHGAPLYAPYPLHIAVPAMMIGHLTVAGFAEALLSGGMVAYLQKAVIRTSASQDSVEKSLATPARADLRWTWIGVILLILGTPLGLLTASTAWGEWDAYELRGRGVRPPAGMAHLFATWSAPFAHYAAFTGPAGYIGCACLGTAVVVLACSLVKRLASLRNRRYSN